MDEPAAGRARPTSSSSGGGPPSSPASFFSATADNTVLEFLTSEVPEQWLLDDDDYQPAAAAAAAWSADYAGGCSGLSLNEKSSNNNNPPTEAAATTPRRRGRRPLPRCDGGPVVSHVEAERQRRDKLHRRFCDLRAAVPTVSRMDKASLLADATAYITELRGRVEQLEIEAAAARKTPAASDRRRSSFGIKEEEEEERLEVRMVVGSDEASLRFTTTATREHAPARLMGALRALDLHVQHASVCRLGAVTVQDAIVDVPAALRDEQSLVPACFASCATRRYSWQLLLYLLVPNNQEAFSSTICI
ncbi:hypothetical protein PR202_ga21689 [Eleusine coracana subsp. coracana]|uniref:Transcription factor n=1 Tax=Eleusine coracana subsp. coracana TaxID=191504 RepID=A0AAV5D2A1_ELECO|nr:hypothetical protein PR202_ga21689 [Eleusine coracana subsp. coracana]